MLIEAGTLTAVGIKYVAVGGVQMNNVVRCDTQENWAEVYILGTDSKWKTDSAGNLLTEIIKGKIEIIREWPPEVTYAELQGSVGIIEATKRSQIPAIVQFARNNPGKPAHVRYLRRGHRITIIVEEKK